VTDIIHPGAGVVFMKVGTHAREPLPEIIARKSGYGRQLTVRSARVAGASWADIGQALGTTRQSAWEAHQRWIEAQAAQQGAVGQIGFDDAETAAARALAPRHA